MTRDGHEADQDLGASTGDVTGPHEGLGAGDHDPGAGPGEQPWWGRPWGEDTTGAEAATAAGSAAGGAGPLPYPPSATSVLPAPPPARPDPVHLGVRSVLVVAIVALLAGGAGAAVGVAAGRHDDDARQTTAVAPSVATSVTASGGGTQTAVEAVAAAVQPAVVLVTEQVQEQGGALQGTGSGVVIDAAKGYVLTNNHVVSAFATGGGTLTVTTSAGRTAPATVVGRDPSADIAVIKVSLDGLTQARIGDSSSLKVGETVVAFGAPLGLQGTVTSGIVSSLNRPVSTQDTSGGDAGAQQATIDAVQTDAAINPGNSGGALVDLSGNVIGINSAIASVSGSSSDSGTTESGSIGVGFAIPIDEAMYTAQQLIATGHAVHAIIGVSLRPDASDGSTAGATVASVVSGGPAATAGIRAGDVIVQVGDTQIPDADSAIVAVRSGHKPGDKVAVTVERGGARTTLTVTLGASAPS